MISLKQDAQALVFAAAATKWFDWLRSQDLIGDWRLYRRKMGLGSARHSDMMLEIDVHGLGQLDAVFGALSMDADDDHLRLYEQMHNMIASAEVALYRPYPDPEQRETIALI